VFRAVLELLITIIVVIAARAILTSFLNHAANSLFRGRAPLQNQGSAPSAAQSFGDLHKDPVCGTYVAASTPFHRKIGNQTFFYCSDACKEKHALVAH
jgi:YHS domain-containing protein